MQLFEPAARLAGPAALASEASGQRGNSFEVRAHSASEDIRAETPVFAG
jgi:hypothetical protein